MTRSVDTRDIGTRLSYIDYTFSNGLDGVLDIFTLEDPWPLVFGSHRVIEDDYAFE
jgi:hypothetical protein